MNDSKTFTAQAGVWPATTCIGLHHYQQDVNDNLSDEEYLRQCRGTMWVNAAPNAAGGGVMRAATDAELLARRWQILRKDPQRMTVAELQSELAYIQSLLARKSADTAHE